MDNESVLNLSDFKETPVLSDERVVATSTPIHDNQPMVDTKVASAAEILEETTSYFVVEESGVVHVKTERAVKKESSTMVFKDGKDATARGKAPGDDAGDPQDRKKEDVSLENIETSITDTYYLQLDVSDNLDAYLERQRVRKLNLSRICNQVGDDQSNLMKASAVDKEGSGENQDETSLNTKRLEADNSKKNNPSKIDDENSTSLDEADPTSKPIDIEVKNMDSSQSSNAPSTNTSEQTNSDKKDNRFIWVSNVTKGTKATDLKMHLAAHGKVQLAKVVTDGKDCFGYVLMDSHEDVVNCMKNLQNSLFDNKEIILSDKKPERKRGKSKDPSKDKDNRKSDRNKDSQGGGPKEAKPVKAEPRKHLDPLTLKVTDTKERGYSEERRRIETLERKRLIRDRESMERREMESRKREVEREKERERQKERERDLRKRERIEVERQRQMQLKLEKERRDLDYEKKMIEKQKAELMRYKRKLLSKEKENENKKRRNQQEDFERKKYTRVEEHPPKHSGMDVAQNYWKSEKVKSPPTHDMYSKKNTQDVCVVPPPPPTLSSNYHTTTEHPRSTDRDKHWYERKEYEHRVKSYVRKPEDSRNYGMVNEARHSYQEKPFSKEQYKHKEYQVVQSHNSWGEFPPSGYKDQQNIPILRNDQPPRSVQRHSGYQEGPYGPSPPDYYPASSYRRVNDYYNRPVERKY